MKKTQFEPLIVYEAEEAEFHVPLHGQTYYELVFIKSGRGVHVINNARLDYEESDLFLISPEDKHYFEIAELTHFVFILFTDSYFPSLKLYHPGGGALPVPEEIMRYRALKEMKLPVRQGYTDVLRTSINIIALFSKRKELLQSNWLYCQLLGLFSLIKLMSDQFISEQHGSRPQREALISYLNQHIYSPEKIRRKYIANHFNIADTYFSLYFKRNFGVTFQEYVNRYRLRLIEARLLSNVCTLRQIAGEFGFVDESHLSHFFKKMTGVYPTAFKENNGKI